MISIICTFCERVNKKRYLVCCRMRETLSHLTTHLRGIHTKRSDERTMMRTGHLQRQCVLSATSGHRPHLTTPCATHNASCIQAYTELLLRVGEKCVGEAVAHARRRRNRRRPYSPLRVGAASFRQQAASAAAARPPSDRPDTVRGLRGLRRISGVRWGA